MRLWLYRLYNLKFTTYSADPWDMVLSEKGAKNIYPFNWLLLAICKGNSIFWHSQLWALGTNGLKRSVLAAWNIY